MKIIAWIKYLIRLCLFFLFSSQTVCAQTTTTKRIEQLDEKTSALTYSGEHDSAQKIVIQYLEQDDLNELEIFYGHFIYANIIKAAGKPEDAIELFNKCKLYLSYTGNRRLYESLINGKISECYFDLSNYTEALRFAEISVELSPDSSLRGGGHAVNFIILGFGKFLEKKYIESLEKYNSAAVEYIKTGNSCELPLCYTKMALVYNAMGNKKRSREFIEKSVFISDSCKIDQYVLLSKRALFDIYRENKEYKSALNQLMEINNLVKKMEDTRLKQQINELELKYENLIAEKENKNLKEINKKNETILADQKTILYISIVAIICLSVLLLIVIRLSRQRKTAKENIEILNKQLEEKVKDRTNHLTYRE